MASLLSFYPPKHRAKNGSRRSSGETGGTREHHMEAQPFAVQERDDERAGMGTSLVSIRDFKWVTFCAHIHAAFDFPLFPHSPCIIHISSPLLLSLQSARNGFVLIQLRTHTVAHERPISVPSNRVYQFKCLSLHGRVIMWRKKGVRIEEGHISVCE